MAAGSDLILVPVDLEPASMRALEVAGNLAPRLGATVVALHVYTLPRFAYPGFTPVMPSTLNEDIAAAARKAVESVGAAKGVRVLLSEGDAATEILAAIEEMRPRLVVMGTHGRHGLSRLMLGSVAEKVMRKSPVPVMTIRMPDTEEPSRAAPSESTRQVAS
jgi:nucleotide-binding universal stress UspA family protein